MRRALQSLGQVLTALLASGITASTTASASLVTTSLGLGTNMTGSPPCDALVKAGLSNRLLLATDPEYETRIKSWWSLSTQMRPWCLFQPRNTHEVSTGLTALLGAGNGAGDWHIAIRSGGHSLGRSNNIDFGVTIDLGHLNQTTYNRSTNIASIGPGGKWKDVYAELHKHGVLATGGRDGTVGVGGFLLGGGSTYFMNREGFGCDSVKNYEVVLANGTVVDANQHNNSDLWLALKGGTGNFGIVTRFDMEALPDKKLSYELQVVSGNYTSQALDAMFDFTENSQDFDRDALVMFLEHDGSSPSNPDKMNTLQVNTDGNNNSPAFDRLRKIPKIKSASVGPVRISFSAIANTSKDTGSTWIFQATITFKNDRRILAHANELQSQFVRNLTHDIGGGNFQTVMFLQPLPSVYADVSEKKGGNMFASSLKHHNSILWTAVTLVKTDQRALSISDARTKTLTAQLQNYAASVDGDNSLIYLNYADPWQNPLGSYPKENIDHIRRVAARYDPMGVFQTRVPGGFKISRV